MSYSLETGAITKVAMLQKYTNLSDNDVIIHSTTNIFAKVSFKSSWWNTDSGITDKHCNTLEYVLKFYAFKIFIHFLNSNTLFTQCNKMASISREWQIHT